MSLTFSEWLGGHRKSITALAGGLLTWVGGAYVPDGRIDRAEWFALAVAVATAAGVYGIANDRAAYEYTPVEGP